MGHSLHSLTYQKLFSNAEHTKPFLVSLPSNKRLIILSDCHLGKKFDEEVFENLKQVVESADMLVINGDFWADSLTSFDLFVNSEWKKLFSLMKNKTYYIFGNHDMPINSDERINTFCTWAGFRLKIKAGDISLHAEHGHLLSGKIVRLLLRIFQRHATSLNVVTFPFGIFEQATRVLAKKGNDKPLKQFNAGFKTRRNAVSEPHEYFAMGHTHVPEIDEKAKYLNSGRTHEGEFFYIEIYKNKIDLREVKLH